MESNKGVVILSILMALCAIGFLVTGHTIFAVGAGIFAVLIPANDLL